MYYFGNQSNPQQPLVQNLYAQLQMMNQAWIQDTMNYRGQLQHAYSVIEDLNSKLARRKEPSCRRIFQDGCGIWFYEIRSAQRDNQIPIGRLELLASYIINMKPNGSYDALYVILRDDEGEHPVVIPYDHFMKKQIGGELGFYRSNPNDPNRKFLTEVFYHLVFEHKQDAKFITIPSKSGWYSGNNQQLMFASYNFVDPNIVHLFPECITRRSLITTDKDFETVVTEYLKVLPDQWQFKMLVVLRMASILLFFFEEQHLSPDHMFVCEDVGNSNPSAIISLLKAQDYQSDSTLPISSTAKDITQELQIANDATVVIRDSLYEEEFKKCTKQLQAIDNDLKHSCGSEYAYSRHLITIITNSTSHYDSEFPAYFLSFSSENSTLDPAIIQQKSSEFDFAVIKRILDNQVDFKAKLRKTINQFKQEDLSDKTEYRNTYIILSSVASLLHNWKLLTDTEYHTISRYLNKDSEAHSRNTSNTAKDEFLRILNKMICSASFHVVPQFGPPYYKSDPGYAFFDGKYINLEKDAIDGIIRIMVTTNLRSKPLRALQSEGLLNDRKDLTRNTRVRFGEDDDRSISVYSISKKALNERSNLILADLMTSDYQVQLEAEPVDCFIPFIYNNQHTAAFGTQILPDKNLNYHMYVSGMSGTGKSYFLTQQAVFHAYWGDTVLIFDQSGTYYHEELALHLPDRVIDKYFDHVDLTQTIPFDLFSIGQCKKAEEKAQCLLQILSSSIDDLGSVQEAELNKALMKYFQSNSSTDTVSVKEITEILNSTPELSKVRDKLNVVLNVIGAIPMENQSINEFLQDKKQIIVFSIDEDEMHCSKELFDMMLMAIYRFQNPQKQTEMKTDHEQQPAKSSRIFVILDEFQDFNTSHHSPLNTIIRKVRKRNMFLLLGSTNFSTDKSGLSDIIGQTKTKVYFRQKDDSLSSIRNSEISMSELRSLPDFTCIIEGSIYSKSKGRNEQMIVRGETYPFLQSEFDKRIFPEEYTAIPDTDDEPEETMNASQQTQIESETDIDIVAAEHSSEDAAINDPDEMKEQKWSEAEEQYEALSKQNENSHDQDHGSNASENPVADNVSCETDEENISDTANASECLNVEEQPISEPITAENSYPADEDSSANDNPETAKEDTVQRHPIVNDTAPPTQNMPEFSSEYLRKRIPDIYVATDVADYRKNHFDVTALPEGVYIHNTFSDIIGTYSDLNKDDIITAINGVEIKSIKELGQQLYRYNTGETVSLHIFRAHRHDIEVQITLN